VIDDRTDDYSICSGDEVEIFLLEKMSASFDTNSPTELTNFSIAFSPQASCYHVYWGRNAVQMVNATICVHHGQHSLAQCHHPGV
jgi:hypothetical protein